MLNRNMDPGAVDCRSDRPQNANNSRRGHQEALANVFPAGCFPYHVGVPHVAPAVSCAAMPQGRGQ